MAKKIKLSLIIPAFNEEKRLPKRFANSYLFLTNKFKSLEIIFINDGSTDKTENVLRKIISGQNNLKLISYPKNKGKGYAIKKGVEVAQGEVIGFTDADFSVDVAGIVEVVKTIKKGVDIVIGDRNSYQSKIKNRPNFKRRFLGLLLSALNQFFLPLNTISDSQNGFKFFKKEVAKKLFPQVTINRWLFDMQLLSLALNSGYKIQPQPIFWKEVKGSKVNILNDLPKVCFDLLKMYFQFMNARFFSLILASILLVLLLPFLFQPGILTRRNGDYSDLVWPDYFLIKQSILEYHQIPLWNPTVFSGIPEIANPQSPLIYPPNILALILPIDLAIVVIYFINAFIGGIFFFMLTREKLKWSILASVAATFTFVFSPFFWSKVAVGHLSQIFAIFLTAPILFFGFSFMQTKKWWFLSLTALVLALQYLNYPTIWYFTNLFGAIFLLGFFLQKIWKWDLRIFLTPILSLIFILPIFLTQLQAGPLITRSTLSINDLATPIWSFSRFFKSILIPSNFLGENETEVWLYPSLVALFLTILGFLKLKKSYQYILGMLIFLVILITLGGRTPLFGMLTKYLPGFSYLRVSTRDWFILVTIIAFLAGFAIENLPAKFKKITFGLLIADLIFFSAIRIWYVPDFMLAKNSVNLSSLFQPSTQYRTYCTNRCLSARDSLPAGVMTADGYHLLILKDYRLALSDAGGFAPPEYTGNLPTYSVADAQPSAEKLGKMAVRWVISSNQLVDPNFIWQKESGRYNLYENRLALPRVRFGQGGTKLEVLLDSPNLIQIETNGAANQLIVADSFFPGWKAKIDEQNAKINIEEGWARKVTIPAGRHRISLEYKPFNNLFNLWSSN